MSDNRCRHGRILCYDCAFVTDAGKRAFDIARSYVAFVDYSERINSWIAFRLEDGGSDGTLYLSKREAIRHQVSEYLCAYFSFRGAPNGFDSAKDATVWLQYHRLAYDNGFRLPDPDDSRGGPDLIMPTTKEQLYDQLRRLAPGVWN